MKPSIALAPLALLSACATTAVKEVQVRSALVDAGVRPDTAACMARPMAEKLSVEQLQRLRDARRATRVPVGELTLGQVYETLRGTLDAETLAVVTRAGLGCAVRG